jgi:hypothetical protein
MFLQNSLSTQKGVKMHKYNAKLYATVAGLVMLSLYVYSPKTTTGPNQARGEETMDNVSDPHYAMAQAWFKTTRDVAEATRDEEAKSIASFLEKEAGIGVARENSFYPVFLQPNDQTKVLIVPILDGDVGRVSNLSTFSNDQTFMASFISQLKLIMLRPVPLSDAWRGVILLHEGRHALLASKGSQSRDPWLLPLEERDTHNFQNRIVGKLGGEKYAQLLREEIDRQRSYTGNKHFPSGTRFVDIGSYQAGLDEAFGPAKSDIERVSRQTQVWMHAIFTLVDEDSSISDKQAYKAALMLKIYRAQGMIK